MLENKSSRVYCFCAVRSNHRSSRSAPKTRSSEARTMTEMGLFSTNLSNTSPSIGGSLLAKLKKPYRTQNRPTLTPLGQMLALDFLSVSFAWAVLVRVQMPAVGTPMIRVVTGQPEGLE